MKKANYEIVTESENLIIFQTTCHCMSSDHIIQVCVDKCFKDDLYPIISILFKTHRNFEYEKYSIPWYKRILKRFQDAWKIITTGDIELESEFMFRDQHQVEDFVNALKEAIQQLTTSKNE